MRYLVCKHKSLVKGVFFKMEADSQKQDPSELSVETIVSYVESIRGLKVERFDEHLKLCQLVDSKTLNLKVNEIDGVLTREDSDGKSFVQINLNTGYKLLLTESLVGFRPAILDGLDMDKLPTVVTTPDLLGVIEALEDSLTSQAPPEDIEVLKKLFHSVLDGGESIGFDLSDEKSWLKQVNRSGLKASA